MLSKKHIIITLLFIGLSQSCEIIADVDIPEIPDRLVVYGIISPDKEIKVHVTRDISPLDTEVPGSIDNANVTITTSNQRSYQGTYDSGIYRFDKSLIVTQLVRYNLNVAVDGFETVHAVSEIPFEVPIESGDLHLDQSPVKIHILGTWYYYHIAELTFTDPIYLENYYRLLAYIKVTGLDYQIDNMDTIWEETKKIYHYEPISFLLKTDVVLDPKPSWESYNHMTFNDELIDGKTYTLQVPVETYYTSDFIRCYQNDEMDTITNFQAVFVLGSIDKSLYEYYTTTSIQQSNTEDIFSEPVQVKSNIENGFGVFGGENLSTYTYDLHRYTSPCN